MKERGGGEMKERGRTDEGKGRGGKKLEGKGRER